MKRHANLALSAVACVVLALLAVFAIELASTQANARNDVTARVHDRSVLAAALIDSVFQYLAQQEPQQARIFGTPTVSPKLLNAARGHNAYLALVDVRSGRVIAHTSGFTPQALGNLQQGQVLSLLRSGHPYGLGNVRRYGAIGVVNLGVAFSTPFGRRALVSGFTPIALAAFIGGELRRIPGVAGAHNYLIDGNDEVLASTNPKYPAGHIFTDPAVVQALSRPSGERKGGYYDQVHLANSTWRILLSAPAGTLFAGVSGLHKWVPWIIFIAFALVALVALILGRRVHSTNGHLAEVNAELATTNLTLERRAEELARSTTRELAARAEELGRSNEELQRFAMLASHDLQEPLRKVRTFTQQLSVIDAERMSDKGRDYAQRANAAAERMQTLIEDLLEFSRVATQERAFTVVELEGACREAAVDLEYEIERTEAVLHIGPLPWVQADWPQMRQLFQNLISNALKFHRPGVAPEIWIDGSVLDGVATIIVRDNGIGFDPQYSERIFRVFERLHSRTAYPGTGVGLALCRRIAERHGGSVTASPAGDVGATFEVTLPVGDANPMMPPAGDAAGAVDPRQETQHAHA